MCTCGKPHTRLRITVEAIKGFRVRQTEVVGSNAQAEEIRKDLARRGFDVRITRDRVIVGKAVMA